MIPTLVTLNEYVQHERGDYEARARAGARGVAQGRTLPDINPGNILYHRCFVDLAFARETTCENQIKGWAGAPTAAILKAIHAILQPCVPTTVRVTRTDLDVVTGIPGDVCVAVAELIRLWSRPHPPVVAHPEAPIEDPGGGGGGASTGGAGGGAARGEGKGKKRAGDQDGGGPRKKSYPPSHMVLRPQRGTRNTGNWDPSVGNSCARVGSRKDLVQKVLSWSADVQRAIARGEE